MCVSAEEMSGFNLCQAAQPATSAIAPLQKALPTPESKFFWSLVQLLWHGHALGQEQQGKASSEPLLAVVPLPVWKEGREARGRSITLVRAT